MTLRRGESLGRYEVLAPIGAGGMAAVYAARVSGAEAFEKRVALKVMLPHLSRDGRFEKMFGEEARVAAQVVSPYVVGTLDLGRDEHEGLYQVMELVVGASLRQLLDADAEPLPLPIALSLLAHVARGLADAHAAHGADGRPLGLVHRDVSPHNVLVGVDGRARLSDFGVARAAASVSTTESGELKGKLAYASPEQLAGEAADARSDVFALGIVAWEVLAGRRLFQGENPLAIVDAMLAKPIPRLRDVRPGLPPALSELVESALVRARDERRPSAADLAAGFELVARDHGGTPSPEQIGGLVRARGGPALAELEALLRAPLAPRTPVAEPHPAQRGLLAPIGAAVLVLGLALAAWAWTRVAPAPPAEASAPPPTRSGPPSALEAAAPPREAVDAPPIGATPAIDRPAPLAAPETPLRPPRARRDRPEQAAAPGPDPAPTAEPSPAAPPAPPGTGLLGVEDFDRGAP